MRGSSVLAFIGFVILCIIAVWLIAFVIRLAVLLLPLIIVVIAGIWVYNKFLKTKK